jgi:hypothetical protein
VVIHDGDMDRPIGAGDVYMRDEDGDLHARGEVLEGIDGSMLRGRENEGGERVATEMEGLLRSLRESGEIEMSGTSVLVAEESGEEDFQVTPA